MTWNEVTVEQYQKITAIQAATAAPGQSPEDLEIEKTIRIISTLYKIPEEQVSQLPVDKFHRYVVDLNNLFLSTKEGEHKKMIRANGKRYAFTYNIGEFRMAQYVEAQEFLKRGLIENLHLIAASISQPVTWYFKTKPNDSLNHEKVSEDFKKAPFMDVYNSVVFFCDVLKTYNGNFTGLFGTKYDDEERGPVRGSDFQERFGWIFSLTRIAEHERVTLEQAWDLPTTQCLNDLFYIKEYDAEQKRINDKQLNSIRK